MIASRSEVSAFLAGFYSHKLSGKVWCAYDDGKRAYCIRGEGLPACAELRHQYPRGWSMMDWVKPAIARHMMEKGMAP